MPKFSINYILLIAVWIRYGKSNSAIMFEENTRFRKIYISSSCFRIILFFLYEVARTIFFPDYS